MKEDIRIFSTRCWSVFWDVVNSLKLVGVSTSSKRYVACQNKYSGIASSVLVPGDGCALSCTFVTSQNSPMIK